ncbi:MAG TPA: carboxypeptidase-like regulatory domain-containing protein [Blastocatellia bacterium]|nr:carboxypeptidase-like regulatory domain-containing protein [Blastocatellia bacterium]
MSRGSFNGSIRRAAALLLALIVSTTVFAQGERGALNGIVTDQNGAVVAGAEVAATNVETNIETKATSTDAGVYRLPYLPAGKYKITVKANGFQTAVLNDVNLFVAQTLTVDIKLTAGQISEVENIEGTAPLLETGTAEIGRYVTKKEFDTWPVAVGDGRRQIQTFIFTSLPGSVGESFQGSINGGQYYSHEILIEGMPLGRFDLQGGSNNEFSPSAETISEFKVQSGTVGAQYGGGQTSVANFAIKSGGNDFHGSAYTYIQNDALRANSFNNKALGIDPATGLERRPRPPFKLLNYGYSATGPVLVPKIYNGRNKTFFLSSLEVTRVRNFTSTAFSRLPTVDFKRGDFSRLLNPAFTGLAQSGTQVGTDALGRPVIFGQIYDPRTTRLVNGAVVRDPFPGNMIPQSAWSPVSSNILSKAGITDPLFDRMLNNIPNLNSGQPIFDERMYLAKIDHKLNDKHRISGLYNHNYRNRINSPGGRWGAPPELPTGVYQQQYTPGRMVRLAYDWTISSNLLNHVALGYNRFGNRNESVFVDQDWPQQIGLQNVPGTHFPTLIFTGTAAQGGGIGSANRLGSANRGGTFNGSTILMDDLTYVRGAHNYKAGVELRKYYLNVRNKSSSGNFNFSPQQTELPGFSAQAQTGHSFASFLLGAAQSTDRAVSPNNFGYRVTQPSFYFMDDWKATQRLTLNLGLRWEMNFGYNEVAGRISVVDLTKPNPGAGNRPGALVFADELGEKGFHNKYLKMISPRLGFAYKVSEKMVVRGGYGVNANPFITSGFDTPGNLGYNGSIVVNRTTNPTQFPQDPVFYLHQRYPDFTATLPNRSPALANNLGIGYIAPDSNRVGYAQNYSLGVQYELPASFVLEVGYIGNKGTRLEANGLDNLNQLPESALRFGDDLIQQLSDRPNLGIPLPYPGFNGTVAQALRPFPQFGNINQVFANFGTSHYDSLQAQITRHLTKGLSVLGAYTWSKALFTGSESAIDAAGSQDVYNRRLERTITSFHIPHFVKMTWIYDLPVGKGRKWLTGGVLSHVIGGWTLTGIHQYRSGDSLAITGSGPATSLFNGTIRPDWIQGVPVILNHNADVQTNGVGALYLNPAAFALVPRTGNSIPRRLGTAPPRLPNVRGPAVFSEDFGLQKKFAFSEDKSFELRADYFNAFNRSGRGNPVTEITDPLFGRIVGSRFGPRNIQVSARFTF